MGRGEGGEPTTGCCGGRKNPDSFLNLACRTCKTRNYLEVRQENGSEGQSGRKEINVNSSLEMEIGFRYIKGKG